MHAVASWFGPHQHGFVPGEILVGKLTMNSPLAPVITSKQTLACAVHLLSLHGRLVGIYLKDAVLLLVCKICILVEPHSQCSGLYLQKQPDDVQARAHCWLHLCPPNPPPPPPCVRAAGPKLLLSHPPS